MRILVTGGAGFIGSALCRHLVNEGHKVYNVDKLTYAGNLSSLASIAQKENYQFYQWDIADKAAISHLLEEHQIEAIMHLAAESHVDRSISGPQVFMQTNILGTFSLLEAARSYFEKLPEEKQKTFRFHHISTDEVFGDLPFDTGIFKENTPYDPSSPYSASKAASDHLVRAWGITYGLPILISNCSNNYGPYHFPEKLIPCMIIAALEGRPLTLYGEGKNIRDWLYVDDHVRALECIVKSGTVGHTYLIGGRCERSNVEVVETICRLLDAIKPRAGGGSYAELITFVSDRPGHDRRYAIDPTKIETTLGWKAKESFDTGIEKTIKWYLANASWWEPLRKKATW